MEIIINRSRPRFTIPTLVPSQPLVIPIKNSGADTKGFGEIMTLIGYDLDNLDDDARAEIAMFHSRLNNMDKRIGVECNSEGKYITIATAEHMISDLWDACSDREDEFFSYWKAEIRLATLKRIKGGIFATQYLSLLHQGEAENDEAKAYSTSKINEEYEYIKIFVDELLKVDTLKNLIAEELAWDDNICREFKWRGVTYYSYYNCM